MTLGPQEIKVSDQRDANRYEIRVDGELAGFCKYELQADKLVLPHTQIDPAFEGRGIGGKLVAYALEDAHSRHLQVVPACSFVAWYMRTHVGVRVEGR